MNLKVQVPRCSRPIDRFKFGCGGQIEQVYPEPLLDCDGGGAPVLDVLIQLEDVRITIHGFSGMCQLLGNISLISCGDSRVDDVSVIGVG